jgi:hypothetical protein
MIQTVRVSRLWPGFLTRWCCPNERSKAPHRRLRVSERVRLFREGARRRRAPLEVRGIVYRTGNAAYHHNPARPVYENLDALPWVTRIYKRDLDIEKYNIPWISWPHASIYTTGGCPAQCTFCLWPQTRSSCFSLAAGGFLALLLTIGTTSSFSCR